MTKPEQSNPAGLAPAQLYGVPRYRSAIVTAFSPVVGRISTGLVGLTPSSERSGAATAAAGRASSRTSTTRSVERRRHMRCGTLSRGEGAFFGHPARGL